MLRENLEGKKENMFTYMNIYVCYIIYLCCMNMSIWIYLTMSLIFANYKFLLSSCCVGLYHKDPLLGRIYLWPESFIALICILFRAVILKMWSWYPPITPQPRVPGSLPGDPQGQNYLHNTTKTLCPFLSSHSLMSIRWSFPESTRCVILQ